MRKNSLPVSSTRLWVTKWKLLFGLGLALLCGRNALAEEPEAEIKLFVAGDKIDAAKKQVEEKFSKDAPKQHQIYFFDTEGLALYENSAGPVILRARQKAGKKPQSTVKIRRDKRDPGLEKKLKEISSELEIQTEWIVAKKGPPGISYALDSKSDKALSELEGADSAKIAGWFSPEQKQFLEAAGVKVDWEKLRAFGRIDAEVWEWTEQDKRVDTEITAELWRLGEKRILELSCKKPDKKTAKQVANFTAFFKDANILPAANPQSKTKQALEYFARKRALGQQ